LLNLISPTQSNYLVKTYPRKFEDTLDNLAHKNQKRRLSEDLSTISNHDLKFNSGDNCLENTENNFSLTEQTNSLNESSIDKSKSVKVFKRQTGSPSSKMKTSPSHLNNLIRGEHENKLDEFISLLQTEKENNFKFENRLIKLQSTTANEKLNENDENKQTNTVKEDEKSLDIFLEKMNQEKLKNEEFNLKLNQMLNYANL
jgi:hypothetical protein